MDERTDEAIFKGVALRLPRYGLTDGHSFLPNNSPPFLIIFYVIVENRDVLILL